MLRYDTSTSHTDWIGLSSVLQVKWPNQQYQSTEGTNCQGWNCRGVGVEPPSPRSCLQTLIFEWKSAI